MRRHGRLLRRPHRASRRWTPLSLGDRLRIWLDADHGITLSSGAVISWASRVGSYVVSQDVAASRPVPITISGKTFVDFDGVDDFLAGTSNLSSSLGSPGRLEIYVALRWDTLPAGTGWMGSAPLRTSTSNRVGIIASTDSTRFRVFGGAGDTQASVSVPATGAVLRVRASVGLSGGAQRIRVGSGAEGAATSGGQHSGNYGFPLRLARNDQDGLYFDGALRHVMIIIDELTPAERAQLDAWLVSDCGAQV